MGQFFSRKKKKEQRPIYTLFCRTFGYTTSSHMYISIIDGQARASPELERTNQDVFIEVEDDALPNAIFFPLEYQKRWFHDYMFSVR
jgi:hypothetical protein